jgi:hypothetical protein
MFMIVHCAQVSCKLTANLFGEMQASIGDGVPNTLKVISGAKLSWMTEDWVI